MLLLLDVSEIALDVTMTVSFSSIISLFSFVHKNYKKMDVNSVRYPKGGTLSDASLLR